MDDRSSPHTAGPGQFPRARAIFESALERPASEREQLVRDACQDDAALLAVVQAMLHADAQPHALLDTGAALEAGRWQPGETYAGIFRIVGFIGAGGMGEVYRAHDVTLGRDVALKVLSPSFAAAADWGGDRVARFRREAQVLASLNHPNIAAIHRLEDADGVRALVLELVDGQTLAQRLTAGPLSLQDVISTARQIAAALDVAHEQGIVHRDLKPGNITLRPDGTVKVLDFGLAKVMLSESLPSGLATESPTITSPSLIQRGVLLGTPAYMSPEQAKGREATRRSDVWAFGAVLYEMLTGERAFKGDDVSETLAAVLRADVDWSRLPASTPEPLRRLLSRCLDRDVTRRLRDIGEARIVLDDLAAGTEAPPSAAPVEPPRQPRRWRQFAVPSLAAVAAAALVAVVLWPRTTADAPSVTRFVLSTSAENTLLVDPQSRDLALTPDGRHVIYKGGSRADRTQLFVYALDQLAPKPVTEMGMPKGPFTSPDGQWIGFFEPASGGPGAAFKKVAVAGGPARLLTRLDGPSRGASWGDNDMIIAASGAPSTGLLRLSPEGGELEVLTRPNREQGEGDHLWPHVLPGSRTVLFTITALSGGIDAAQVAALDVASGRWTVILRGASQAQYLRSGHLVYIAGGALWAVAFDVANVATAGSPVVVVPAIMTLPTGVAEYDVARDGTLAYVGRGGASAAPRTLVWVNRQGEQQPLAAEPRAYATMRLSPDGTRVALEIEDRQHDIWVWHFARQTLTRVTTDPGLDESPIWMPDGSRLVFTSQAGGVLGALFWQAADGSGIAERLSHGERIQRASSVLADGTRVLFSDGGSVSTLALDDSRRIDLLVRTPEGGGFGEVSPDGRWLAYVAAISGTPQVFVSDFANPAKGRTQVSPSGGIHPRWASGGRELFYISVDGALMAVSVERGVPGTPTQVADRSYFSGYSLLSRAGTYDVTADGQRFLMIKPAGDGEPSAVVVVKNWIEELKRLVPVGR